MPIEKHILCYLIANWKTSDIRLVKKRPVQSKLAGSDIPLILDLTLKIPEAQELRLKANVTLGEVEVSGIALDALED